MKMLMAIIFALPLAAFAIERPADPVSNAHKFEWDAVSKEGKRFHGNFVSYCVGAAFAKAGRELDELAGKGFIKDGTEFEIEIEWKDKKFKRVRAVQIKAEEELPRGPNKEAEAPRGPIRIPQTRR